MKNMTLRKGFQLLITFSLSLFTCIAAFSQGAVINSTGAPAHPSAMFEVSSNTGGVLIARMTELERDAISLPAEGLQIYNLTSKCLEIYIPPIWQKVFCGCTPPSAPLAALHIASETQIVWNWNTVIGASGYKINTINDYGTALDIGVNTDFSQAGLTCNMAYTIYVWAYGACSNSVAATFSQTTQSCFSCGDNLTFIYRGGPVTYGTILRNGICWMDRNLGASQAATAVNDVSAYGDLFQWGRLDDGHQLRNSSSTNTLSSIDIPGHSNFIASSSVPYDWSNPQNDNRWQGIQSVNNVCPAGWRLPVETEINNERLSWGANNSAGAYGSSLKFTNAGYRMYNNSFYGVNTDGFYYTSTIDGSGCRELSFYGTAAFMNYAYRASAMSVRCLKDY